jgi:hypothetical protein
MQQSNINQKNISEKELSVFIVDEILKAINLRTDLDCYYSINKSNFEYL